MARQDSDDIGNLLEEFITRSRLLPMLGNRKRQAQIHRLESILQIIVKRLKEITAEKRHMQKNHAVLLACILNPANRVIYIPELDETIMKLAETGTSVSHDFILNQFTQFMHISSLNESFFRKCMHHGGGIIIKGKSETLHIPLIGSCIELKRGISFREELEIESIESLRSEPLIIECESRSSYWQ